MMLDEKNAADPTPTAVLQWRWSPSRGERRIALIDDLGQRAPAPTACPGGLGFRGELQDGSNDSGMSCPSLQWRRAAPAAQENAKASHTPRHNI